MLQFPKMSAPSTDANVVAALFNVDMDPDHLDFDVALGATITGCRP